MITALTFAPIIAALFIQAAPVRRARVLALVGAPFFESVYNLLWVYPMYIMTLAYVSPRFFDDIASVAFEYTQSQLSGRAEPGGGVGICRRGTTFFGLGGVRPGPLGAVNYNGVARRGRCSRGRYVPLAIEGPL